MEPKHVYEGVRDALSVRRVFGEPIERNGVTLIPASGWIGGAGGGTGGGESPGGGEGQSERGSGEGMGFGGLSWPAGAFEIRGDHVTWHPAVDYTRLLMLAVPIVIALIRALSRR
jgi:uncharacterized spore protein YtfJ